MEEIILSTESAGRLDLTINREGSLNSLDGAVLTALSQRLDEIKVGSTRSVFIRGAGPKAFVAGADIAFMKSAAKSDLEKFIHLGQAVMRKIEALPVPVIAVVHGFALGGGLELALACDLIVASTKAKLGLPEVGLGLIPGFGGTQRLAKRTGYGTARRLIYTGDTISAEEASRFGIIDWLVEPERIEETLAHLSGTIAKKGPLAIAAAKRSIQTGLTLGYDTGLTTEVEEFLGLADTKDTAEGLAAFVEKRPPNFTGK